MNLQRASVELGYSRPYLSVMKSIHPEKFNYILSLDKNIKTAVQKYIQEWESIKNEMSDIWYELEDNKQLMRFSEHIGSTGIYKGEKVFYTTVPRVVFSHGDRVNHNTFNRMKEIIEEYKRWVSTK